MDQCLTHLNKARLILLALTMPMAFVLSFMCPEFFSLMGLEQEILQPAVKFLRAMVPGMVMMGLADTKRKWLQLMRSYYSAIFSYSYSLFIHILCCYHLVIKCEMGMIGIAYSFTVSQALVLFLTTA